MDPKSGSNLNSVSTQSFIKNANNDNPRVRALAMKSLLNFQSENVNKSVIEAIERHLGDQDPYVRKTAAFAILRLWQQNPQVCKAHDLLAKLENLLQDSNSAVLANVIAVLTEITLCSQDYNLEFSVEAANKLLTALNECNEWAQVFILEAVAFVQTPVSPADAELLIERVAPRLQHSNSAVALSAVKAALFLMNFVTDESVLAAFYAKKMRPPLITLVNAPPEVQYVALRNILLIIQHRPDFLQPEVRSFFCKYNDEIYVKMTKLEILFHLTTPENVDMVLRETVDYASEVDIDFSRKAVQTIGRLAVKFSSAAPACVEALCDLLKYKVDYIVQECIVVLRDVFRRYPNKYDTVLALVFEYADSVEELDAKAAMIWMLGEYADRVENVQDMLSLFLDSFSETASVVQLALLTAIVKLFVKRPAQGQQLMQQIFQIATENIDNPDVRDRAYFYWRLLSADPVGAKEIILAEKPLISADSEKTDPQLLSDLLLQLDTLASIYHRPAVSFISTSRPLRSGYANKRKDALKDSKDAAPSQSNNSADLLDLWDENSNSLPTYDQAVMSLQGTSSADDGFQREVTGASAAALGTRGTANYTSLLAAQKSPSIPLLGLSDDASACEQKTKQYDFLESFKGSPASTALSNTGPSKVAPDHSPALAQAFPNSVAKTHSETAATNVANLLELTNLGVSDDARGFRLKPWVFLESTSAQSVAISGTFSRDSSGVIALEMTVLNRSATAPLSLFAIQLNRNSLCLELHNNQMQLQTDPRVIGPGAVGSAVAILSTKASDLVAIPSQTVDNLQVALNTSAGVCYFQVKVPFYPLFESNAIVTQSDWLEKWNAFDVPSTVGNCQSPLSFPVNPQTGKFYNSAEQVKQKLWRNNVFVIAVRPVANIKFFFYGSLQVLKRHMFLFELELDFTTLSSGSVIVRSDSQDFVMAPFVLKSISDILSSFQ